MQPLKYLFSLSLAIVLMTSCKPDAANNNSSASTPAEAAAQGTYATPVIPNPSKPKVQLLLRSPFWVAEYWVNHEDNSQNKLNQGRWWSLKEDGTFTTGQWEDTYSYGSWVVYNDGPKDLLHLDAVDDRLDMEFELQAVSSMEDYMSWSGTKTYKMSRIAVKAIALMSMPTKQQFGVQ